MHVSMSATELLRYKIYLGPGLLGDKTPNSSWPEAAEPAREAREEDLGDPETSAQNKKLWTKPLL